MTTYILVGGYDSKMTDEWSAKMRNTVLEKINGDKPRILSVPFASLREDWEWKFRDRRMPAFERLYGKDFQAKLAYPDTFREDAKWANVVFLHGGDTTLLAHYLNKFDNLHELFADKVVIGSSAGAEYLAAFGYELDWRRAHVGSSRGFVQAAILVHYRSDYSENDPRGPIDWIKVEQELRAATDLPVYLLREGEFEVFEEKS